MGYILEFRDQHEREELLEKFYKAKKAVCEAWEALEKSYQYNERGNTGNASHYGGTMDYRNKGRYREEPEMRRMDGGRFEFR